MCADWENPTPLSASLHSGWQRGWFETGAEGNIIGDQRRSEGRVPEKSLQDPLPSINKATSLQSKADSLRDVGESL